MQLATQIFDTTIRDYRPATAADLAAFRTFDHDDDAAYRAERMDGVQAYLKRRRIRRERARIFAEAERSWRWLDEIEPATITPPPTTNTDMCPLFSEEAIALRFAERHAHELRYVAAWSKWMRFDGRKWMSDDTRHVFSLVRSICREVSVEAAAQQLRSAPAIASAKTVAAVERLAQADRRLAASVDQWDADDWVLNTPSGVIDLRSGALRPTVATDYATKMTAAGSGGDCPTWLQFLNRITNGDIELQKFLQRIVGYSLTGSTGEHALFFGWGTGANGKSVFTDAVAGLLGDYHTTAPMETFIASNSERHPTDLAGLMGARLVSALETEQGRRWAESKIKSITGGDRIKARFMRQDFFEFKPKFKLLIVGNHKPGLRAVDEAMRRRMNLLPFTVTIPPAERDPYLSERLKAEWPGILQWAIEGCLEWQRIGLNAPACVREATDDYLASEDTIGAWLEDRCTIDQSGWEASGKLFADWQRWATAGGEFIGTQRTFIQKLLDRGLSKSKFRGVRGVGGLRLLPAVSPSTSHFVGVPLGPLPAQA